MPHYLIEAAYKDTAAKAMIQNPQNRSDVVRKTCESLGGSMHAFFFAFGEYDVVTLVELPSNQAAMSLALAVGSAGGLSKYRTTVLMTPEESIEGMRKAKDVTYSAPR